MTRHRGDSYHYETGARADVRRPGYLEVKPYTREELERRRHGARVRARTRRIDAVILAAVLVLVAWVLFAWLDADQADAAYPGERPAGELALGAIAVGLEHWAARDVRPCAGGRLEVLVADDLTDVDVDGDVVAERAELGGCRLWVSAWVVAGARDDLARARRAGRRGAGVSPPTGLLDLCAAGAHGLGHNAGLGHTAAGLMGESLSDDAVPFACRVWARELVADAVRAGARHARRSRSPRT